MWFCSLAIPNRNRRKEAKFEHQRVYIILAMAATSLNMASTNFSMLGWTPVKQSPRTRIFLSVSGQQEAQVEEEVEAEKVVKPMTKPRPVEPQINVQSKNMEREYGGQWLSSVTRHIRIYAAYIDPETWAFDQTQMDKLTLLLDPTDEFLWTEDTCYKVYSKFQELVDHYEVI